MRRSWPLLLSAGLCAAVYAPRLSAPLVWDDRSVIAQNKVLDAPVPLRDFFTPRYYSFSGEESWRPLATMSYAALVRVFGKSPAALRGFHLLLHGVNAALLVRLCASLGLAPEAAAWAGALWLIHAAHVETLMCVAFNEEVLVALGLLAMLLAHRSRRTGLAALALAWSVLSKETGVLGLPLAVLSDLLEPSPHRRWREYSIYSAVITAYLAVHFGPLKGPSSGISPFPLPAATRAFFGLASLATAARVLVAPLGLELEYFALPPDSTLRALAWASAGLATAFAWALLAARAWRKDRALAFLLLWPIPFLLLTSPAWPVTVFNTRLFAERWLYLPALGAAAALAWGLSRKPALGALVLVFWAGCGALRAADWASEPRLWTTLLDRYPWCAKAEQGLGEALFKEGRYPEAREAFQRALYLRESGQDKILAAYARYSERGFVSPESPSLHRWLGHVDYKLGELEAADAELSRAAALDPSDGFVYRIAAYAWAQAGDFPKASAWLSKGLAAHPDDPFLKRLEGDAKARKLSMRASFE